MIKHLLMTLLFFLSFSAWAGLQEKSLKHGGEKRLWWEYAPKACEQKVCPLVLAFHGGGGRGDRLEENIQMMAVAEKNSFILIYPNGLDRNWNDGRPEVAAGIDDLGFIDALLKVIKGEHKIDESRIFATGISNGALFSFRLACERSEVFAAIAPVAGHLGELLSQACQPKAAVSILNIVGTEDRIIPFSGGTVKGPFGFKKLGKVLSSDESTQFWVKKEKCQASTVAASLLDVVSDDETKVKIEKYLNCQNGAEIQRYIVEGGGHTWPGGTPNAGRLVGRVSQEIKASEEIWKFFAAHAKQK